MLNTTKQLKKQQLNLELWKGEAYVYKKNFTPKLYKSILCTLRPTRKETLVRDSRVYIAAHHVRE